MELTRKKSLGAYYTPDAIVRSLVSWAVRSPGDRLLDPACGDGRFLSEHEHSVGVEHDRNATGLFRLCAPGTVIHQGDFFAWAEQTGERFECAAGNPPFIRYQRFCGAIRETALRLCRRQGAAFNSLSSSWAPFIVATAGLLKPGGRLAFVVPAEIGHAPYATPLLKYLLHNFDHVQIVAVREKLFKGISEDCWLLHCDGFGGTTNAFVFTKLASFGYMPRPPDTGEMISVSDWETWQCRLRPFVLDRDVRGLYQAIAHSEDAFRLGSIAKVGIGYVTGANDFFHLRPSEAARHGIPDRFLVPAVRNGRSLQNGSITAETISEWRRRDEPSFLLRLTVQDRLPQSVSTYLDSSAGQRAREAYKCRNRNPWFVVPDVHAPDAFLSYMSGQCPSLVANEAKCVATNSVHVVRLNGRLKVKRLRQIWSRSITQLSCELEGHPLGGGLLKLEPREAARIVLSRQSGMDSQIEGVLERGIDTMRTWRHYG